MSTTSPTPMPATGSLQLIEAVTERFDGAPVGERRRWSDEFKERAVAAALEPGVNVSALARRLGISPPQLFGWRKASLKKQTQDVAPGAPVPLVEIMLGGVLIRVSPDLDEAALRRILRAVRSA
ncbi:transposase [Paracoccus hibiscisoli]|uniref:Transposase n=1 Tax=Paracoccus hibiscisoli TaxID=2023261 RepID=A0A4U0QHI2_9RHOB|nr:transposase [Paracoccus hibiscisoli]